MISPPNSDTIVTWRFLRNRRLILRLRTIFRAVIYRAHRAVIFAIAWFSCFLHSAGFGSRPNDVRYWQVWINSAGCALGNTEWNVTNGLNKPQITPSAARVLRWIREYIACVGRCRQWRGIANNNQIMLFASSRNKCPTDRIILVHVSLLY